MTLVRCDQFLKFSICEISKCPHRIPHEPEEYYGSMCTDLERCAAPSTKKGYYEEVDAQCVPIEGDRDQIAMQEL
jgi:hypothetical protein